MQPDDISTSDSLSQESVRLLQRYRQGDAEAADALFHRYVDRLVGLARKRLSEKLAQRVDAEDVVQSVYRSFFVKAREGQYAIQRSGDLWRLLSAITVNKVLRQAQHHGQQKRDPNREQFPPAEADESRPYAELFAADPSETDAVAVTDELDHLMRELNPMQRQMLERRLHGESVAEIAESASRSEHTVRRFLAKTRETLERRLSDLDDRKGSPFTQ